MSGYGHSGKLFFRDGITFEREAEEWFREGEYKQYWRPFGLKIPVCNSIQITRQGDSWTITMSVHGTMSIPGIKEGRLFSFKPFTRLFFTLESCPERPEEVLLVAWKQEE
jgi:hypothetical protein